MGRENIKFITLTSILLRSYVIQRNLSVKETMQVLSVTTALRKNVHFKSFGREEDFRMPLTEG